MRSILLLLLVVVATVASEENHRITCNDLKSIKAIGAIFVEWFSSDKTKLIDVKFKLSTNDYRKPVEIDLVDWSQLKCSQFDPSKRTYVIIHGYLSNAQKDWVLQMKDALLDNVSDDTWRSVVAQFIFMRSDLIIEHFFFYDSARWQRYNGGLERWQWQEKLRERR